MAKRRLLMIRDYILAWTGALIVYNLVRSVGTVDLDGIQVSTQQGVLLSPVFGALFGIVFGFSQVFFERLYDKRTPLLKLFLLRLVLSFGVLILATILAFLIFISLLKVGDLKFSEFVANPPIFVFYGYILLVDILISLFRQVSLMLGPGILKKLFLGEFYKPREEERIFMFLDLKSSTEMAEKLGHFKYSRMIQDCFDDLAVVTKTGAEIYQYVGDEAVLTWHKGPGLKDKNCIHAFYRFKAQINAREDHYLKAYGHKPFFKAGLNVGKVTVAEVGKIKKEIAYHGDTINTAARIQSMCNDFRSELLISEELKDALGEDFGFDTNHMGHIPLKGKASEVSIFNVEDKS